MNTNSDRQDDKRDVNNRKTALKRLRRRLVRLLARKGIGEWTVICLTVFYALAECINKFYHQHDMEALTTALIVSATFLALLVITYDGNRHTANARRKVAALRRELYAAQQARIKLEADLAASYEVQKQVAKFYADLAVAKVKYRSEMLSQFPSVDGKAGNRGRDGG